MESLPNIVLDFVHPCGAYVLSLTSRGCTQLVKTTYSDRVNHLLNNEWLTTLPYAARRKFCKGNAPVTYAANALFHSGQCPLKKNFLDLDKLLAKFVFDVNSFCYVFPPTEGVKRLWIHRRCQQLGLTSVSHSVGQGTRQKCVEVTKPPTWSIPERMNQYDFQTEDANKERVYQEEQKRRREAAMSRWSTECDECGEVLSANTAFYHYSGAGPMCEDCIEQDSYLSGYKWEAKADFWY